MRGLKLVLVVGMLFLASCTPPNMSFESKHSKRHTYSKKNDKIMVIAKSDPSGSDLEWVSLVKSALQEHGFSVVDSITQADRALVVDIHDDVVFRSATYTALTSKPAFIAADSGRAGIILKLFDIESLKNGNGYPIWEAKFSTEKKYFTELPEQILAFILKSYGKSKSKFGHFKPPPNRGKKPE